ncbi:IS200/IS605 family transposase [Parafrankia sp. FMc2]|uniref:IS200/IS605 family transposase n=1 Tax=Parafrankia sp. FMc2 TaxID=3233196 RepID=UPI0034D529B1
MVVCVGRQVTAGAGGGRDLSCRVVWCPRYRRAVLAGLVRDRLDSLLREKCAWHDWLVMALGIEPEHGHLFVKAHSLHAPSYIANQLRGFTSHVLRAEFWQLWSRLPTLWSRSYFVATVGAVCADTVRRYIDTQNERPWRGAVTR